jgi:hypothetical protein
MKASLKVTADFTDKMRDIVKSFRRDEVLVGIPESKADRRDDAPINNATIMAINEFGSPANNIPARPVMAIGIRNAQEAIAEEFKKAAIGALSRGQSALTTYYNRAGIIASNSIKKAINDQIGIDPPSESTLRARKSKGFKGTKALIVTGQLRNSITYVVKGDA